MTPPRPAGVLACATLAIALHAPGAARADATGLTIERAVRLASERAESQRAASERARAADARVDRAYAGFLPDLTVRGAYTRNAFEAQRGGVVQPFDQLGASASVELSLFNATKYPLLTQAKLDREAADLRAADASRLAGFDGAMAYLAVLGAEQVVTAAERRVELARTSLADAKARTSAGLAGTNDVTRAALELASAERDLARARGEVDATRLALGHLIGSPVDGPLVVPDALLEDTRRSAPAADTLVPNTRKRLDVAAAGKSADALGAGADEPLLRTLPTFALLGELRKTNDSGPSAHDWDGLVGVSLTWVLFDGGERYAERAERDALARAGTLDAEGLARRAELELRDAASALRTGQAAAAQAEAAVRAAEQNSREASELYKNGLATSLAVADAGVQLFTAYIDLVRARYGVAQSLLEVRRAAGLDALGGSPR